MGGEPATTGGRLDTEAFECPSGEAQILSGARRRTPHPHLAGSSSNTPPSAETTIVDLAAVPRCSQLSSIRVPGGRSRRHCDSERLGDRKSTRLNSSHT